MLFYLGECFAFKYFMFRQKLYGPSFSSIEHRGPRTKYLWIKFLFAGITILITEWRTKYRRLQNRLDNQRNQTAVDSLLNFETVNYIMLIALYPWF